MPKQKNIIGVGRRKSSVASVLLIENNKKNKNNIIINKKPLAEYFPTITLQSVVLKPLVALELENKFIFKINVKGGGKVGQAGACLHGISRALLEFDEELKDELKKRNFLTRDSRVKERKKAGRPGARKRFQFSKR